MPRRLHEIAADIAEDWEKPIYSAVPYLDAMREMSTMQDSYGADSAESVVLYFLTNAGRWRGPVAKAIKTELRDMLKHRGASASRVAGRWAEGRQS